MRYQVSRRLPNQKLFMPGSVSFPGICPTHLSRKFARYRILSALTKYKTLSHGYSRQDFQEHTGRCQRNTRLENLCRLCTSIDQNCQTSLQERGFGTGTGNNHLRTRFQHHRSLSGTLSLGQISKNKSSCKNAHSFGPAWRNPNIHQHHRRQGARCQHPRLSRFRGRIHLCYGSWLSRFSPSLPNNLKFGFLRDQEQIEYKLSKNRIQIYRQNNRPHLRPDYYFKKLLRIQRLSQRTQTHQILRQDHRKNPDLFNQQLFTSGPDDSPALQMPLAGGTFFQVDQTTFTHQEVLWNIRERSQDTNLDCSLHLRANCGPEKKAGTQRQPLHNFTDFECQYF